MIINETIHIPNFKTCDVNLILLRQPQHRWTASIQQRKPAHRAEYKYILLRIRNSDCFGGWRDATAKVQTF